MINLEPRQLIAFALVAALAGCASTQPNTALEEARIAVESAGRDPVVVNSASVELNRARQALEQAQSLYETSGNKERAELEHHAYLAKRYAAVAGAQAKAARADERIGNAEAERNEVLLAARTREAEQSARETAQAQELAEQRAGQAESARAQAVSANERSRRLQDELTELQAQETERGLVLTLGDVLFDTNEATLNPGAASAMEQLVTFLNEYPERALLIEGHTDSSGAEAYNQALSERRANAVRNELAARGVAITRMVARGIGENRPVVTNETSAGRQQNRRVEIVISDEQGQIAELRTEDDR